MWKNNKDINKVKIHTQIHNFLTNDIHRLKQTKFELIYCN